MSTNTDPDPQTDHSWDNRRLILASLAPRTTPRPARRAAAPADDQPDDDPTASSAKPKKPVLITRSFHAASRALHAGGRQFDQRIPRENRMRVAVLTTAAIAILGAVLAGVNYLSTDVTTTTTTTKAPPPPPPPSHAPLHRSTILTGMTATDMCTRDDNYSDVNQAFDTDFNTAWTCTRAKGKDGQIIQVDFHRQVTLEQVRALVGQSDKHHIITVLEVWFPKDLQRNHEAIKIDKPDDWRGITLAPPATLSKLLLRVAETSEPQPGTNQSEPAAPTADDVTTVALSEIQFIGTTAAGQ